MKPHERASKSPNPSGWRKESHARAHYAQLAKATTMGGHERGEIWNVTQRAMRALKVNATQQKLLETLVWRTFEEDWTGGNRPIVWLSNASLAREAGLAIATSTVRSSLASLANLGLITFQDSGNCRRAGSRKDGQIVYAYGIDLSVLEARYEELRAIAEAHESEEDAIRLARTAVQRLRRSIPAHLQAAQAQRFPGRWPTFRQRYERVVAHLGRASMANRSMLERARRVLERLLDHVQKALVSCASAEDSVATATENGCALETTNQPHFVDCNQNRHRANARSVNIPDAGSASESTAYENGVEPDANVESKSLPPSGYQLTLEQVLTACPEFAVYADEDIRSWGQLISAAGRIRPWNGISPSAWEDACTVMGKPAAAVAMAIIIQKRAADQIREPGGYLRGMTDRHREGQLRLDKTIRALLNVKHHSVATEIQGEIARAASNSSSGFSAYNRNPFRSKSEWEPRLL